MKSKIIALAFVVVAAGCAGQFPKDIWPALKACGTSDVSWGAATEVFGDIVEIVNGNPAGETDLLALLASDVGGGIPCLVNYFESQGGSTGAAATKFKAAHAKELKAAAARGPSACRDDLLNARPAAARAVSTDWHVRGDTADAKPGVATRPADNSYAYLGESVAAAADRCTQACGSSDAIAPPGGCLCQKKIDGKLRWVASR